MVAGAAVRGVAMLVLYLECMRSHGAGVDVKNRRRTIMKSNVGGVDRIFRIVIGLVLIALAATGVVGWWGWIGVLPLLTGLFRFCPAYPILGFSTCPLKQKE